MDIGLDLQRAYDDGYKKGWEEAEAYALHCGDETPITNADRIRAMTDEELAAFLCNQQDVTGCSGCAAIDFCHYGHNGMIDWLRQEATDGK